MGILNAERLVDLLRFAVVLGVLIFVHELGHFIMARRAGVLVQRFSLGFGKRLFGIIRNGTDFCVSLIPLGGYVKMAGQEDLPSSKEGDEEDEDEDEDEEVPEHLKYSSKTVGQRVSIVVAGSVMNVLLGAVLFSAIFMIGLRVSLYMREGVVGDVIPGSPAAEAGVKPGDRVVSINGRPVSDWTKIRKITVTHPGQVLRFGFERQGKTYYRELVPVEMEGFPGAIVGLDSGSAPKIVSVIEGEPASRAGLRAGDVVDRIDGKTVFFPNVVNIIGRSEEKRLTFDVTGEDGRKRRVEMAPARTGDIEGVIVRDGVVVAIGFKGKGSKLKPGDRIVAINGRKLSGEAVDEEIARSPDRSLSLTVLRRGRFTNSESELEVGVRTISKGRIGALFTFDTAVAVDKFPWYQAIPLGIVETGSAVKMLYQILAAILTGRLSAKNIGGPIMIYKVTSATADLGLVNFLYVVAAISVNLGVINLVPLPVLDGGHVLFLVIEKIRRKPLGDKQMEIIQQIGLAIILLLVALVFYNDIVNVVLQ